MENYLNNYASPFLPPPYIGGDLANIYPKNFIVEDAYTITPNVVNQLKYGFTRFFQNIHDATQGVKTVGDRHVGSHQPSRRPGRRGISGSIVRDHDKVRHRAANLDRQWQLGVDPVDHAQ